MGDADPTVPRTGKWPASVRRKWETILPYERFKEQLLHCDFRTMSTPAPLQDVSDSGQRRIGFPRRHRRVLLNLAVLLVETCVFVWGIQLLEMPDHPARGGGPRPFSLRSGPRPRHHHGRLPPREPIPRLQFPCGEPACCDSCRQSQPHDAPPTQRNTRPRSEERRPLRP